MKLLLNEREREGYFCSELIADALIQMGLLPATKQASKYWPSTLASADLELLGAKSSKMLPLNLSTD